jgi:hypothetical protein
MADLKYIKRFYKLDAYCKPGRVLVLYGARQVGKTTLIKHYLQDVPYRYKLDSGDNVLLQSMLTSADFKAIANYVAGYELIVIDEAQKIPDIGQTLKIMVDQHPELRIIVTGSSAFDLAGQIGEPLTGRKKTLILYPIAQLELAQELNAFELKQSLEEYLLYGCYPHVLQAAHRQEKREDIIEIAQAYLLNDILTLDKIKNSKLLLQLLQLLALQLGNEVSYTELGQQLAIDGKTVSRYLDLLEKSFVIYNLRGFSRNLRKEITKKSKYYFYDPGIRNAIIANFNALAMRDDVGALWENFMIMERIKKQHYQQIHCNNYFWRTWDQKEIDFIEEREGHLFGFEFKWGKTKVKAPKEWLSTYPNASFTIINPENYLSFVT